MTVRAMEALWIRTCAFFTGAGRFESKHVTSTFAVYVIGYLVVIVVPKVRFLNFLNLMLQESLEN